MNFLKKHYEKLILAVLLTVFILLLAVQLLLWKESAAIQIEKLKQFRDPPPNYQTVKFEDEKSGFMVLEKLNSLVSWRASSGRGNASGVYTDFMQPYPMALCPYCVRVIPLDVFPKPDTLQVTKCPLCRENLKAPQRTGLDPLLDTDRDRIPDQAERLMGLNPEDPDDAYVDSDADEFSNYEEYLFKTAHTDPKKRPEYHAQFHVDRIFRPELPFQLKNIMMRDLKDLKNAMIQLEVRVPEERTRRNRRKLSKGKWKVIVSRVGDIVRTSSDYQIMEIIPKFGKDQLGSSVNLSELVVAEVEVEEVPVRNASGETVKDALGTPLYTTRAKKVIGEKIRMKIGEKALEPREEIHLIRTTINVAGENSRRYELHLNSEFTLGSMRTGVEKYKLVSVDRAKTECVLLLNGTKKVRVGKESLVSSTIAKAPKLTSPKKRKKKQ